jgi:hypothetical protein
MSAAIGAPCQAVFGAAFTCTRFLASNGTTRQLVQRGDTSDLVQLLNANGLLRNNVGLSGQFSTNIYISNQGASSYNGLLMSIRKRMSSGLQFDFNYTWSNSIDNGSSVVNTVAGGLVCDLRDLRVCRGPSDFDIRHLVNANFIYELPFGKGQRFAGDAHGLKNQLLSGWEVSGIFTARSGLPFSITSGTAFPVGFNFLSPAVYVPNGKGLTVDIHDDPKTGLIQYFKDPAQALLNLRFPQHGEIGNRNAFRGPGFWNLDSVVMKKFPISEKWGTVQLRWEAYNLFNHNAFSIPSVVAITSGSLGSITTSATTPREMQFAVRWDF